VVAALNGGGLSLFFVSSEEVLCVSEIVDQTAIPNQVFLPSLLFQLLFVNNLLRYDLCECVVNNRKPGRCGVYRLVHRRY